MNDEWLGKRVSLNCGSLGFYQGVIASLQLDESTITIKHPFQNGVASTIPLITLSASDILDLKIIEDDPVENVVTYAEAAGASSIPSSSASKKKNSKQVHHQEPIPQQTPQKKRSSRTFVAENLKVTSARSSANKYGSPVRKTPIHGRGGAGSKLYNARDQECFGNNIEQEVPGEDFDFEKNLALFNKRLVFDEIEDSLVNQPDIVKLVDCNVRKPEPKYRNDENVLSSAPTVFRQISTGEVTVPGEYVCDTGLIVPAISSELRTQLFVTSESAGMLTEIVNEHMARAGSDLGILNLGGSHRLNPSNRHQTPIAVLLSGPSRAGTIALAIGRHLAAHGVKTHLYLPDMPVFSRSYSREYGLYKLTGQKWTHSIKDLPKPDSIDLIINGLEDFEMYLQERSQPWHREAVRWGAGSSANVISIDPPPGVDPPFKPVKISILPGFLPLWHPDERQSGKLHLVNCCIPKKIYKDLGITYSPPYGAKNALPLHHK